MISRTLQRLMWKDARALFTLTTATLLAVLGFNALLVLADVMIRLDGQAREMFTVMIWLLTPMLVAMGAAPVLVGGEEESGSLAWLRSLPTSWLQIVTSKLLVSAAVLVSLWCVATLCAAGVSVLLRISWDRLSPASGPGEPIAIMVAGVFALGLGVMLVSFMTSFAFKSPITALIMVIPLLVGALIVFGYVNRFLLLSLVPESERAAFAITAVSVVAELCVLLVLMFASAYYRLRLPRGGWKRPSVDPTAAARYRPPSPLLAAPSEYLPFVGRPSPRRALLFSAAQPIRWHLVGLSACGAIAGIFLMVLPRPFYGVLLTTFYLVLVMIAALTFYADAVGDRCRFLYDRGISPTLVWWSRLTVTGTCVGIVASIAAVAMWLSSQVAAFTAGVPFISGPTIRALLCGVVAGFAILQLVSQWSPRPALTFFAGPIAFSMVAGFLAILLSFYPDAYPVLLLSAGVLLFASWWLMPFWMNRRTREVRYVLPMLAAIALAALLPYTVVLTVRFMTAPALRVSWRQELASLTLPNAGAGEAETAILSEAAERNFALLYTGPWVDAKGREERLQDELRATDVIGYHTSMRELLQVLSPMKPYGMPLSQDSASSAEVLVQPRFPSADAPLQFDAIRILLKWSRITREHAIEGKADFRTLLQVAEQADWLAAKSIQAYLDAFGINKPIAELIGRLPSERQVEQSRRVGLIRSWKQYQVHGESIAGTYSQPPSQWWLAAERYRARRYLDEVVHMMLSGLHDTAAFSPADALRLGHLESEAYLGSADAISAYRTQPSLSEWMQRMQTTDERFKRLRRSVR